MELLSLCRIIVPLVYLLSIVNGKPATNPPKYGPEAGMEQLHGVLMHGDGETGEDHKNEDTYLRLQAIDTEKAKQAEEGVGPCKGGECAHELMHNEGDNTEHMDKSAGVETENKESGPMDAMGSLHGVMMHGDEEGGKDHGKEHDKLKEQDGNQDKPGVKDAMDEMHGVMMHGDEEQGVDHGNADKEKSENEGDKEHPASNVESAHQFMHEEGDSHNDAPRMDVGPRGVPSVGDPHEAIHGDLNVQLKLGEDDDDDDKKKGGKSDEDANFQLGFSFPFISDSLMDEIELLKKTWLPKYWTSEGKPAEKGKSGNVDISNLDTDTDILHDMAAVGDTGPSSDQEGHHHNVPEDKKTNSPKHDES